MSFRLLRQPHPALALQVRNNLMREPIAKPLQMPKKPANDHFRIALTDHDISAVIEALADIGEHLVEDARADRGSMIMLKSLLRDWIKLGRQIQPH